MDLGTLMIGGFGLLAAVVIGFFGVAVWTVTRAPLGEGKGFHERSDLGADLPSSRTGD